MGDDEYADHVSGAASLGMSRAAKKRAKKKHKQQRSTEVQEEEVGSIKRKKRDRNDEKADGNRKATVEKTEPPAGGANNPLLESQKPQKNPRIAAMVEERNQSDEGPAVDDGKLLDSGEDSECLAPVPASIVEITPLLLLDSKQAHAAIAEMTERQRANSLLNFLLQPSKLTTTEFYATHWERQPLLVQGTGRTHRHRLDGLLSLEGLRDVVQRHALYYGRDVNVTRYEKDATGVHRRLTLDPKKVDPGRTKNGTLDGEGAAAAADPEEALRDPESHFVKVQSDDLWDKYYRDGDCTLRWLCPHQHSDPVHALLSALELEWGCMVGANAYLTPPGKSQGFAPHYDDIEAFCLQLEGQKRWKVYAPLRPSERLPRASSEDYRPSSLLGVTPVLDVVLSPGDVLYMPRGWIHQACTLPSGDTDAGSSDSTAKHSLHLTVSAMQRWAWVDLLEIALPAALQSLAAGDSTLLREGLPRNFLDYTGIVHDDGGDKWPESLRRRPDEDDVDDDVDDTGAADALRRRRERIAAGRETFRAEFRRRIGRVVHEATNLLDDACDQLGVRFCTDRLPPPTGWMVSRGGVGTAPTPGYGTHHSSGSSTVRPESLCRLTRPGIARLVLEGGKAVLCHCLDNSRVCRAIPPSPLEFELDDAPALEQLLTTVEPHWICVQDLFHDSIDEKVGVAQALLDEGLLMLRAPESG